MPVSGRTGPERQGSKTGRRLGRCNPDFKEKTLVENKRDYGLVSRLRLGYGINADKFFGRGRGRNKGRRFGRS